MTFSQVLALAVPCKKKRKKIPNFWNDPEKLFNLILHSVTAYMYFIAFVRNTKSFAIAFLAFSLYTSCQSFGHIYKHFLRMFQTLLPRTCVTSTSVL